MTTSPRKVAIVGGNRIPFARSNGKYADASNQDMLTATFNGLASRYNLQGGLPGLVPAELLRLRQADLAGDERPGGRGDELRVEVEGALCHGGHLLERCGTTGRQVTYC